MKPPRNIARACYLLPEKALTRAQLLSAFGLIALSLLPSAHTLNSAQALRRGHPAQAFQTELVREFKGVSEVENATANLPRHRQRRDTSQDAKNTINDALQRSTNFFFSDDSTSSIGRGLSGVTLGLVSLVVLQSLVAFAVSAASIIGGSTAGAASGATAVFNQAQFLAVAGKFAGDGTPDQARNMSTEMGWTNFHFFSLPSKNAECKYPQSAGAADLWGTLITCAGAFAFLEFFRLLVKICCMFVKKKRHRSSLFPIPGLEVALFLTQVLGLSEASGYALAAGCREYVIGGAVVLGVEIIILIFILRVVVLGVTSRRRMEYEPGQWSWTEGLWHLWHDTDKCCLPWCRVKIETLAVARVRGTWEDVQDENAGVLAPENEFSKKWGGVMSDFSKKMWLFSIWIMARDVTVGLILSNLSTYPKTLTGCLMGIYAVEALIAIFGWPWLDRISLINAVYVSWSRVGHVIISVLYVNGIIVDTSFMAIFHALAIASIVPLSLQSTIQLIARFIHFWTMPPTGDNIFSDAAGGAAAAGTLVAMNLLDEAAPSAEGSRQASQQEQKKGSTFDSKGAREYSKNGSLKGSIVSESTRGLAHEGFNVPSTLTSDNEWECNSEVSGSVVFADGQEAPTPVGRPKKTRSKSKKKFKTEEPATPFGPPGDVSLPLGQPSTPTRSPKKPSSPGSKLPKMRKQDSSAPESTGMESGYAVSPAEMVSPKTAMTFHSTIYESTQTPTPQSRSESPPPPVAEVKNVASSKVAQLTQAYNIGSPTPAVYPAVQPLRAAESAVTTIPARSPHNAQGARLLPSPPSTTNTDLGWA